MPGPAIFVTPGAQPRLPAALCAQDQDGRLFSREPERSTGLRRGDAPGPVQPNNRHARRMLAICSPTERFSGTVELTLPSKQSCPHGDDSADPYYQNLLFSVARGGRFLLGAGVGWVELGARKGYSYLDPPTGQRLFRVAQACAGGRRGEAASAATHTRRTQMRQPHGSQRAI